MSLLSCAALVHQVALARKRVVGETKKIYSIVFPRDLVLVSKKALLVIMAKT